MSHIMNDSSGQNTSHKSAITSRAGGMRKAPGRGRGHALLVIADL